MSKYKLFIFVAAAFSLATTSAFAGNLFHWDPFWFVGWWGHGWGHGWGHMGHPGGHPGGHSYGVPGPVAGVGLPVALVAGAYAWLRRRKHPNR